MREQKKFGIIGGNGKFGRFISSILAEMGHEPLITDVNTKLSNISLVQQVDIILLAVPIDKTLAIIKEISPFLLENKVIIDITSIKQPFIPALLETKANVISIHPMFSPNVDSLENQTIIAIPIRDNENWIEKISNFCKKHHIKLKLTTAEYHDKMMSLIQVLIHFNTISIGVTLSKLGFDIKDTLEFTSPIYRMELAMIGRIFAQDGRLYGNIPMYNSFTPEIILEHKLTLEHLSKLIITKDLDKFVDVFNQTSSFFKNFKDQAMDESNFLITKIGEYQNT